MQSNENRSLKKQFILLGIFIVFAVLGFLYSQNGQPGVSSPKSLGDFPIYGWIVEENLGLGEVPSGSIAERFVLEHGDGWGLLAYCFDTELPPPPVGTICELINGDTFWCGDAYQPVKIYDIQSTPPTPTQTRVREDKQTSTSTPTVTETQTATSTATSTATATHTMTATATETPTPTETNTQTATCTATSTTAITSTQDKSQDLRSTETPTPTLRTKMGGGGNVQKGDLVRFLVGMSLFVLSGLLALPGLGKLFHKKTNQRR